MWFLYLDESGDLGFDFVNKRPSRFFTITILAVSGIDHDRALFQGARRTVRKKLHPGAELKGSNTEFKIKEFFYRQVCDVPFEIYSMTLNKKRAYERLTKEKGRVYNYIARQVLERIPFEKALDRVTLVVDKSKGKPEIKEFNTYINSQLEGRLNPGAPLDISHLASHENYGLQAVDLFSWGIYRKYEHKDTRWFDVFREKIAFEEEYSE